MQTSLKRLCAQCNEFEVISQRVIDRIRIRFRTTMKFFYVRSYTAVNSIRERLGSALFGVTRCFASAASLEPGTSRSNLPIDETTLPNGNYLKRKQGQYA